ncbi:bifunctional phosphoribosyl-AMP cyclohydrolase/phosphoribosyl-ATP diphosphatase HisIE [Caminibacter mediatlanticus TB-2]|uniref:Histidine biosynthesis bifunctional protein HisIE n=1 Tax=Caminibacter mediatlanticus TB-2 TaxID=391592 RepID=A0AAI9F2D0_9BACT|nr:bifunctional phosphoribosyl-AMP cyclohydrolase/phosphoribosyl-ATP diphosphatase HisIE [Caminibacter mediatlanticus]EDM23466.1 Phosphoribosyl-AMP cyclohydrolase [Caminibacter mediatlanticus TB-2]QCT94038.1 bifunctional phosphoribosyl-AMP cyclohydrolase/phosphoribosyl-ATP diphosphatase HisIE [Caminibacter mediatlanticus TB-2]
MVDFEKNGGLVPVIVQDIDTNEVLMLAYMNKEALELTKKTGLAHFFSRSRNKIWQKGESSGNIQEVKDILVDCDNDTILLKVKQKGVACHTGRKSCFFTKLDTNEVILDKEKEIEYNFIDKLYHTLLDRKNADPKTSYVSSLYNKGENSLLKKIAEEAAEFCFAVKDNNKNEIIYEAADLAFHTLIALAYKNIHPEAILEELKRREGISGIEEKKSRKDK